MLADLLRVNFLDQNFFLSTHAASDLSPDKSKSPDNTKSDAISNTMTAITIVIAVITLLLSLGTTWFIKELKKIDISKAELETLQKRSTELHNHLARQSEVIAKLWKAKQALQEWIEVNARSADRWATYNKLAIWLELLMAEDGSPDYSVRRRAFDELTKHFPDEASELLLPIKSYCESCHHLHGGKENSFVGCKIFSGAERLYWAEKDNEGKDFI
jgi:hypothetical protein